MPHCSYDSSSGVSSFVTMVIAWIRILERGEALPEIHNNCSNDVRIRTPKPTKVLEKLRPEVICDSL